MALDALGLNKVLFWRKKKVDEFNALKGISLEVGHGELVGVIGRNGAGKSTLLKLITGNFAPTSGRIAVNGSVQALMQVGLGFHPEFTGYENIRSSLAYNGLTGEEYEAALADVIDFVELGDFLHQPMKTYSLGMRSRLQFAAATAVRPDILIIDEILGAGDAYFSAKSAARMSKLTQSGCTLLLVSHSSAQILQFCDRAIWLHEGKIVSDGEAINVVKEYEQFSKRLEYKKRIDAERNVAAAQLFENPVTRQAAIERVMPHLASNCQSGDLSQWEGFRGLRMVAVEVVDADGNPSLGAMTGETVSVDITVEAEWDGVHPCYFHTYMYSEEGLPLSNHCSGRYEFGMKAGERRVGRMTFDKLMLGNGRFIFTAGIYRYLDMGNLIAAEIYDLFSRSFVLTVFNPRVGDDSLFLQPCHWDAGWESANAGAADQTGSQSIESE